MAKRLGIVVMSGLLAWAFGATGCAHPYSGEPEKLRRMPKEKPPEPEEGEEGEEEVVWSEECRVNFLDDRKPKPRKKRTSERLARSAGAMLEQAAELEGEQQVLKVIDAINKLKSALGKDQFNPEATYKMAVAYTLVRKKGCALQLLQRLQDLQRMPEVAREAELAAQRATRDPIFDPFRKEADAAVGL